MITSTQLYWITRLDGISTTAGTICILIGIALFLMILINIQDNFIKFKCWLVVSITLVLFLLIVIFVPTTKEMAAILILPKILNSQTANKAINELPANIVDLANDWIKELIPEKK